MNNIGPALDAYTVTAKCAWVIKQTIHEDGVGQAKVFSTFGSKILQLFICGKGVADLLDLPGRTENPFTVQNSSDLFETEGVSLDLQRGLYRLNTRLPPQTGGRGVGLVKTQPSQ